MEEEFQDWVLQLQAEEIEKARKRIAKGEDTDKVLSDMSHSLKNKLLHPILKVIRDTPVDLEALERGRLAYFEMMKHRGPVDDSGTTN
jgi:glutamyl-tRNA reductase